MKKIVAAFLLSFVCSSVHAQKISFTNNSNEWNMLDSTVGCCIPVLYKFTTARYEGKVKFSGLDYEVLKYDFGTCLVREDKGRVYVIGTVDSTERVLYDFNLGLGDTLRLNYPEGTYISWVQSLDSSMLHGVWHKVWHFEGDQVNISGVRHYRYNVIEGIGCTNGVYYPASPYALDAYSDQLLCFKSNMGYDGPLSLPVLSYGFDYTQLYDNDKSCAEFQPPVDPTATLGVAGSVQTDVATFFPNPVGGEAFIQLPAAASGVVTVTNLQGAVVSREKFSNTATLHFSCVQLSVGAYQYEVVDALSGQIYRGRFVKQ